MDVTGNKTAIAKYYVRFSQNVNTGNPNYFTPCQALKIMVIVPDGGNWRERIYRNRNKQVANPLIFTGWGW